MAYEITSFINELMPLCVRIADLNNNVREEFLLYSLLTRVTGEAIASGVLRNLAELGLDAKSVRSQGYDGASNLSSEHIGLQALIQMESPLAVHTHCTGHCLNLVIKSSYSLPVVRNVINKVKSIIVKLQSRAIDIVDAYNNIDKILSLYKQLRSNINSTFDTIYKHAERMAASVNVQPSQPRICRQQVHHPNAATNASTIEEWYQINAAIPFLDHSI
uniref:DUF4371 domain-containing protein n=1 Tax=Amphimedon queenslandica TaxID=400682 RepID=A0A1X7VGM0_AMPQE